jgi:hypothetical protein
MGKNYNPNMDYFPFACGALQKMKLLLGGGPDLRITLRRDVVPTPGGAALHEAL